MSMKNYANVMTGILLVEGTPYCDYFINKVNEENKEEGSEDLEAWEISEFYDVHCIDDEAGCCIQTLKPSKLDGSVYDYSILLPVDSPTFVGFLKGEKMTKEDFVKNCKETWGEFLPEDFDYEANSGEVTWVELG